MGAWMAQLAKWPASAQVMHDLTVMGSSPTSESVLTAQSLEPALDSVCGCVCVSAPSPLVLCLSKINKC